jgi:hypothetical protein
VATAAFLTNVPGDPIIGHGAFRYRINQQWCRANPQQHPVKNCHEMVMDNQGRIYMTTDDTRNNILVFTRDGNLLNAWGNTYPGAHGLTLHDENGTSFLYITDYERHQVIKTTLEGREVKIFDWPADAKGYKNADDFKPTETALAPNGDLLVADGYGQDYILRYGQDGVLKQAFGGAGQLKNAHGIAFDNRRADQPCWLVTSRAENMLKRFDMDGNLLETIHLPGAYICRPVVHGQEVYFAVLISQLPWDSQSGFVCILDANNKVVAAPGANVPRYDGGGILNPLYQTVKAFQHPHDVLVDQEGHIYVSQWNSGQVYPTKLIKV